MAIKKTALTLALSAAFAASLAASPIVNAAESPFAMQSLDKGYMVAEAADKAKDDMKAKDTKAKDGKCGEGKCGANKAKAEEKK